MKKKYFVLFAVFLLVFSAAAFSQGVVDEEMPVSWSANVEASWIHNYIYHGVNFYKHNQGLWMLCVRMTDPSGAFSANPYVASGKDYTEYGAEMSYTGKFFTVTVFPFEWTAGGVSDSGVVLGASLFKGFVFDGLAAEFKVGFLGGLVSKDKELNGTYYYGVFTAKDFILSFDMELEAGYNLHFFVPGGKGFIGSAKISNSWELAKGVSIGAYIQQFVTGSRINKYDELSACIFLNIKII